MEDIKINERKKPLYIPQNALDNNDYISGIGKKEVQITAVVAALGIILIVYVFIQHQDYLVLAIAFTFLLVAITLALIHRNRYDECFIDYIKQLWKYWKMQKRYVYRHYNIYEGKYEEDGREDTGKIGK